MNLKFCSCRQCRAGLHRPNGYGKCLARLATRRGRRITKVMLKKGNYEIPTKIAVGYTD